MNMDNSSCMSSGIHGMGSVSHPNKNQIKLKKITFRWSSMEDTAKRFYSKAGKYRQSVG